MAPFLEPTPATRVSWQCASGRRGQEMQDSTRKQKKHTPGHRESTDQSLKIRKDVEFPTEMGIDRPHPEPRIDFLGSGTPKNKLN